MRGAIIAFAEENQNVKIKIQEGTKEERDRGTKQKGKCRLQVVRALVWYGGQLGEVCDKSTKNSRRDWSGRHVQVGR